MTIIKSTSRLILYLVVMAALVSCTSAGSSASYDARVDQDTHSQAFHSLQAAIDAAPDNAAKPYRIYVAPGIYREKLYLAKSNMQLLGAGQDKTRLIYDDYAGKVAASNKTLNTPGSATLTITGSNIRLENLSIENRFDFLANDVLPADDPKRISGSQAVALFIEAPADRVLVRRVRLLGYQDTLFVNAGRSWFDQVLVAGNVDFIFGKGNALFTHSEIKTLARGKPGNPHGYITAPSTQISSEFGLTFIDCKLTRDASVADNSVPLGRPWHPTTQFDDGRYADPNAVGKTVFINSWMDGHITRDGWYSMSGSTKQGGRQAFLPEDARFFEFGSKGPGAAGTNKRRQLTRAQVKGYSIKSILGDWQPR